MARTKNTQRPADRVAVDVGATGTRPTSRGSIAVLAVSVIAAIWAVAMMTSAGRRGYVYFFSYAEWFMGVIALVSLSVTIMIGLVATDRLVLSIRQRVLLQSAHRTTGVIAVTALFVHVWTKVVENHASVFDVFIPFLQAGPNRLYVGFGTLSGLIMVLVMWTGIARARFVGRGSPSLWRGIHAISYLMWPIALVHGLGAGRPAATWVTVSYVVCVLGVLVGLAVRLSVSLNRRKDFSSTAAAGGLKPVGSLVPTTSPVLKRPSRREKPARVEPETLGPVAVDPFRPASPVIAPPVAPPPMAPMDDDLVMPAAPRQRRPRTEQMYDEPTGMMPQYDTDERPRRGRRVEEEIEYDEPRGRRYPGVSPEETGTRMRVPSPEETGTRMRRPALEDTGSRTRIRREEFEDTGSRARIRGDEFEDTGSRARIRRDEFEDTSTRLRRAEMDAYDEPAPRRGGYADEEPPAPRSRRRGGDVPLYDEPVRGEQYAEPAYEDDYDAPRGRRGDDSGRHSRAGFVDGAGFVESDETPTLVDMASRRARREGSEPARAQAGPRGRRGGRGRDDEAPDDGYWSQLRGEAN